MPPDPLQALRSHLMQGLPVRLLDAQGGPVEAIKDAQQVEVGTARYLCDAPTSYRDTAAGLVPSGGADGAAPDPFLSLSTVYFAYLTRERSYIEYFGDCTQAGVKDVPFLDRADLISYLTVPAHRSPNVEAAQQDVFGDAAQSSGGAAAAAAAAAVAHAEATETAAEGDDASAEPSWPCADRVGVPVAGERVLVDRFTVNACATYYNFDAMREKAVQLILKRRSKPKTQPGRSSAAGAASASSSALASAKGVKRGALSAAAGLTRGRPGAAAASTTKAASAGYGARDTAASAARSGAPLEEEIPIIIIPNATTSLLSLDNVKAFLEDFRFEAPHSSSGDAASSKEKPPFIRIRRPMGEDVQRAERPLYFIYDSAERFRPDEWARVVAVFTTGQAWQFKHWVKNTAVELFRSYKGYHLKYDTAVTDANVAQWDVQVLTVNSFKRHLDKQCALEFWKSLVAYGTSKKPHLRI